MSINETQQHIVTNPQELPSISEGNSSARSVKLTALQTNIAKELEVTSSMVDTTSPTKRTVALQTLQETLGEASENKVSLKKVESFLNDLPKSTQKLFKEYLELFAEPANPEKFKSSLSQEEFQAIYDSKDKTPLGEGGSAIVYQSAGGKYALKVFKKGKSAGQDKGKNEALNRNAQAFDPNQFYCNQKDDFITKYVGTFKTKEGIEVAVFEKIEGQNFAKCNADTPAKQIRLLAQATTAMAICDDAGCPNTDMKPENIMVTKDSSSVKLTDQGGLIDLTHTEKPRISYTPTYCPPELCSSFSFPGQKRLMTPACGVYSMGVTILEKLESITTAENRNGIKKILQSLDRDFRDPDNQYRYNLAERIADWCWDNTIIPGDKAGSEFIGILLEDCLACAPKDRISAAQLAEILQVFSSYLEAKETNPRLECPDYDEVKAIAIEDCPKGIPIAIRKMVFDADQEIQQKAISIIENLAKADPSYKNTPSYGFVLILKEQAGKPSKETFEAWAKTNPEIAQELKERIYIQGQAHSDKQDMPVSEEIYKIINPE